MPIEMYFVDKRKRPEDSMRTGFRGALLDMHLTPLEPPQDPYSSSNQGRVYRLVVEEVKEAQS